MPLSERFHLKTQKLFEAYQILVLTGGQSDVNPIRFEMKTVSCKRGLYLQKSFKAGFHMTHFVGFHRNLSDFHGWDRQII